MDRDEAAQRAGEFKEKTTEKLGELKEKTGEVLGELRVKGQEFVGKNEQKIESAIDRVAGFVDDQTKGKYHGRIGSVTQKAKGTVERLGTDNGTNGGDSASKPKPDETS